MSNISAFTENMSLEVYDALEDFYRSLSIGLNRHNSLGFNCGQGRVLRFLSENGKSTQSQLVSALGITASSVSEISDKLLSSGYICKESDYADKRKSYLSITSSGLTQLKKLQDDFITFIESSFSVLTSDELSELYRLLLKLSSSEDKTNVEPVIIQSSNIRRGTRL